MYRTPLYAIEYKPQTEKCVCGGRMRAGLNVLLRNNGFVWRQVAGAPLCLPSPSVCRLLQIVLNVISKWTATVILQGMT